MHSTNTNTPLFATRLWEFTVEVYATHVAYRQYWSQQGTLPLSEIASVERSEYAHGLGHVVVTTLSGKTVGCMVRREDRAALCAAIREAQQKGR